VFVVALGLAGCSGDPPRGGGGAGGASGSGGSGGEPPLGCSSTTYCGGDGFVCGVHAVAACGEVDCGPCRFRGEDVGFGDITTAPDGSVHLALAGASPGEVLYARVGSAGLEPETVATDRTAESVALAVAEDGTVHVVYIAAQVMHASKAPGASTWDVSAAADAGESVAVAVDGAGTPHILVVGEDPQTRQRQVAHVTRDGTNSTITPLDGVVPVGGVAMARGADGTIVVVSRTGLQELAVLELSDGAFVRDTGVPAMPDQPAEWSAAVGSDGTVHVVSLLGNYTLRTGSRLVELTRSGGAWTLDELASGEVTHGTALAGGPDDGLHLLYFARDDDGLFYTRPGSPRRLNVDPACEDGEVRVAVDGDDQPHVLYRCDSQGSRYLAPIERFGDDYIEACQSGASLICNRACDCGAPDCCYNDGVPDGSNGCFFGPGTAGHDLCVADMMIGLCSDLTADPAALLACRPTLESTTPECVDAGYAIPPLCFQLIQANR